MSGSTGAAGSNAGGAGGSQTDAGDAGTGVWKCIETGGVCDCQRPNTTFSATTCEVSYTCCYTGTQAGSEICSCTNSYDTTQCATFASNHAASVVAHCPPDLRTAMPIEMT